MSNMITAIADASGSAGPLDVSGLIVSADSVISALTFVSVFILVAVAVFFVWTLFVARRQRLVSGASQALMQLDDLNSRFGSSIAIHPPIGLNYREWVDSKSKFDRFDLPAFMNLNVLDDELWIEQEIKLRIEGATRFATYRFDLEALEYGLLGRSSDPRVSEERFAAIEQKLFTRQKLNYPTPTANVRTTVSYTSPMGQNSYTRHVEWNFDQLRQGLAAARDTRERQSTTAALRQRERTRMTPGLRAKILKRDGSRCRMCGASAAEATLHVDHIIPVSLDGRTVAENLQTLCQSCNLGKGNRFIG